MGNYRERADNGDGTYSQLVKLTTENPFGRKHGQLAVSVVEPWEMRMARLGLIKCLSSPSAGYALTQGSFTNLYTSLGSPEQREGYNIIPIVIIFSVNGPGLAHIEYATEPGGSTNYVQRYFATGGAWEFKPEGIIKTGNLGAISAKFKADNASTTGWFNMHYAEVSI